VATGGNLASTWRLVDVRNDLRDERWGRGMQIKIMIMITAGVREEKAGLGGNTYGLVPDKIDGVSVESLAL
jgi:hypothetical protein